jgi:hypothetical protein
MWYNCTHNGFLGNEWNGAFPVDTKAGVAVEGTVTTEKIRRCPPRQRRTTDPKLPRQREGG